MAWLRTLPRLTELPTRVRQAVGLIIVPVVDDPKQVESQWLGVVMVSALWSRLSKYLFTSLDNIDDIATFPPTRILLVIHV